MFLSMRWLCNTPNPYPSLEQGYGALPEFSNQMK
ncbi:hypothetical protein Godav_001249, partial [Gossypium davidsonii]|nr:hypothetical protein [Gossypium davidsonii]